MRVPSAAPRFLVPCRWHTRCAERGRDQWETHERHEYTLTDVAGGNPRLLCWRWNQWWLARPVDATLITVQDWTEAIFEGRKYCRHQAQTYTSDRACGFLTFTFQWRASVTLQDFVAEPFGAGGHIAMGERFGQAARWVGEFLKPRDVMQALAISEFPANSPYRATAPVAPPASPSPLLQSPPARVSKPCDRSPSSSLPSS